MRLSYQRRCRASGDARGCRLVSEAQTTALCQVLRENSLAAPVKSSRNHNSSSQQIYTLCNCHFVNLKAHSY